MVCPHSCPICHLSSSLSYLFLHRKQDTNWNTPTPLSTWHGVIVDDNNALLELNLEDNNLEGTLPSCITLCSKLKRLNLRGNKLTGFPPFLS